MLFSVLTALLFGLTPVFASRSARLLGAGRANLARLLVAAVPLGLWAHLSCPAVFGPSFPWFLLGGIVGFGIGGVAMFQSLTRLGPNLSNLIVQCLSVLSAALVEWLWLGTRLTPLQCLFGTLALLGVILGLLPRSLPSLKPRILYQGIAWSLVSALAQGSGAVLSRKAFQVAKAMGDRVDPGTAAYERVLGGILIALLALALERWLFNRMTVAPASSHERGQTAWFWVMANALTGPVMGVTCYQWALRGHPAGIVQAIVATAPLFTIPVAAWLEKDRPRPLYYLGAPTAVTAIAALWLCTSA